MTSRAWIEDGDGTAHYFPPGAIVSACRQYADWTRQKTDAPEGTRCPACEVAHVVERTLRAVHGAWLN